MSKTKISIVLPNQNGASLLEGAISSFVEQSHPDKELIIVDGRSTDGSHEILKKAVAAHREVVWINEEEGGLSAAINLGISHSSGEVVGYLGSDDRLCWGILNVIAGYHRLSEWGPPWDAIYFDSINYYAREKRFALRRCPDVPFTREGLITYGTIAGLQNVFFRSEVATSVLFNVGIKQAMDYEFYLNVIDRYPRFLYVPQPATINIQGGNISQDLEQAGTRERLQVALRHSRTRRERLRIYRQMGSSRVRMMLSSDRDA